MIRLVSAAAVVVLAGCASETPTQPQAELVGVVDWDDPDERHGGLSGIEVDAEGRRVVAITDRATLVTGEIHREAGVPVEVRDTRHFDLTTPEGKTLTGFASDSEGLALVSPETVAISFEGYHRVWLFDLDGAGRARLPLLDAISELPTNSGIEALAVDGDGRLLAMPERPQDGVFPVWRWDGTRWSVPFTIPRRGPMKVVGADIGPDGRLYVLERRIALPVGFRSRVRRFEADGTGEATLLRTPPGRHGNLEGIAVWQDEAGSLRLTMVSDDNFLFFQRGQIVEYRLSGAPGG